MGGQRRDPGPPSEAARRWFQATGDLLRALGPWAGWIVAGLLVLAFLVQPVAQARRAWHLVKRVKAKIGYTLAAPPPGSSAAVVIQTEGEGIGVLADFETEADLDVLAPVDGLAASLTPERATHGRRAALLIYPKGATYPGLKWENPRADGAQDWSGYQVLKADVANLGARQAELVVKVKGGRGQYLQKVVLGPNEARTIEVPLGRVRGQGVDLARVHYLNFFVYQPPTEVRLVLDAVRLESGPGG